MDKNKTYFYISGFISISFFLIILFLTLFAMTSDKVKNFALEKDNYISVSLDMSSIASSSSTKSPQSKELDINNLFDNLWTQGVKTEKVINKKLDKRVLHEIQKKIKSSDANKVDSISKVVQKIDSSELSKDSSNKSTALEVNKYLAKIQALVYNNFFPPANSQGNSVKAVIELSAIGKVLDFRILNYSSNENLNDECKKIKSRLLNVVFPVNPDNSSGNYVITLTSKE